MRMQLYCQGAPLGRCGSGTSEAWVARPGGRRCRSAAAEGSAGVWAAPSTRAGGIGRPAQAVAVRSSASCAAASNSASRPGPATSWSPAGQPSAPNPAGMLSAGCPLTLNAQVSAVE